MARTVGKVLAAADGRTGVDPGVGPNDAFIAAMASVPNDAGLTADTDDFEVRRVAVESY